MFHGKNGMTAPKDGKWINLLQFSLGGCKMSNAQAALNTLMENPVLIYGAGIVVEARCRCIKRAWRQCSRSCCNLKVIK